MLPINLGRWLVLCMAMVRLMQVAIANARRLAEAVNAPCPSMIRRPDQANAGVDGSTGQPVTEPSLQDKN